MDISCDDSDNTFSKQDERRHVFRLRREELEERFMHLRDDMLALKTHSRKQEEKIKKMASKLIHLVNEKKRMGRRSDKETEDLIAKMQKRIRDLYRENVELKAKLCCADTKYVYTKQLAKKHVEADRDVSKSKSDVCVGDDVNRIFWQFIYWLVFTLAFLVMYKFFMSNLCNYLLDYYLSEFLN